jgi:hypothetical protein
MVARALLATASLLLAIGGTTHFNAYGKAVAAVQGSNLPPYFGNALKGLWLMDSAGMLVLAAVCALVAITPNSASGWVMILLGLIPLSTAVLLYVFIGGFFGAHILIVTAIAIVVAGSSMR